MPHRQFFVIIFGTPLGFFDRVSGWVATDSVMVRNVSMYTLHKAKEEIDAVAKHATDIASHVLTLSADVHAELQSFKKELLDAIDKKFVDLERTIQGDTAIADSSAVADLGAKVSLLSSTKMAAVPERNGSQHDTPKAAHEHEHEHGTEQHPDGGSSQNTPSSHGDDNPNVEHHSEGNRY